MNGNKKYIPIQGGRRLIKYAKKTNQWHCVYCGVRVTFYQPADRPLLNTTASRDHFIPKSSGGSDDSSNIVMACRRCNSAKGNGDPFEFLKAIDCYGHPEFGKRGDLAKWYKLTGYYPPGGARA